MPRGQPAPQLRPLPPEAGGSGPAGTRNSHRQGPHREQRTCHNPSRPRHTRAGRAHRRPSASPRGTSAQGKIAVILFWNPKGADDVAVRGAAQAAAMATIAVSLDRANQVTSFGTITRGIQVYGTPTILIVAKEGQTITLTGLHDAFSIEQAIDETRHS